jgi:hypothetical protein
MKNSKKFYNAQNVLLLPILLVALLFVFASCGDGGGGGGSNGNGDKKTPEAPKYAVVATDVNGNPQFLNLDISGDTVNSVKAGRAITFSGSQYTLEFWGVIVSSGTVAASGNIYTFTPSSGTPFTFNTSTNKFNGTITLTNEANDALNQLADGSAFIDIFKTLTLDGIAQGSTSVDSRWVGTWKGADENIAIFSGRSLVLTSNSYEIRNGSAVEEIGTFIYFSKDMNPDYGQQFVFLRNGKTPKTAQYEWEGVYGPSDPLYQNGDGAGWLEFTTSFADSMKLAAIKDSHYTENRFWVKQ